MNHAPKIVERFGLGDSHLVGKSERISAKTSFLNRRKDSFWIDQPTSVDWITDRLIRENPDNLMSRLCSHFDERFYRVKGRMGRQENARVMPESLIVKRFSFDHVKGRCRDMPVIERPDKSFVIDARTSRGVNDIRPFRQVR
jgi:hypothetical protein